MDNQNIQFRKLTPTTDFNLGTYEDALNFVFKNNDIKNVAITGPYGAGKTSLIETYKKQHPENNYINVSLAHFNSENTKSESDDSQDKIKENILEGKILNQLIHQINSHQIPKTNFKVKQNLSGLKVIINTICIILFLVLMCFMLFFDLWSNFINNLQPKYKATLDWTTNPEILLLSGIISLFILGIGIYSVIILQNNRNIFRKLNVQGNEIEVFEESEESYFDKYLNEVLYIFENSGADAIIFEDIDRYQVSLIFEKLREINTLVNNKRIKKKKTPIKFLFLLRDDVFMSKDRTKFFDFIIPVIPVIDGSNSYEQFIEHFKKDNLIAEFDTNFLQGLSLYIDDMRILKNIYNEFLIYKNRLNSIGLIPNKLLAIITYKNIFPKDFSELQLGSGFVYTLFNKKGIFIQEQIEMLEIKISEKENFIEKIEKEVFESLEELESAYFIIRYDIGRVNERDVSSFASGLEMIREMKKKPTVMVNRGGYRSQLDFQGELSRLNNNPEYVKRKKMIESKDNSVLESLHQEISQLKRQKIEVTNWKLSNIITKENIDSIFKITYTNEIGEERSFEEIKGSAYFPLIKYLIRNGYIDETFSDYMTYFYENSLNISDKIFLRSIADQKAKEYTFNLKNPELIISRLNLADFSNEEVLNFDLLAFLLNKKNLYENFLNVFIIQLKDNQNFKFINNFLEYLQPRNIQPRSVNEYKVFFDSINSNWINIFENIINNSNLSNDLIKQFAVYLLYYSSEEDLLNQDTKGYLSGYISNNASFLEINDPNIEKIIKGLIKLKIRFREINYLVANKSLFDEVYNNHLFELNFELINLFLEKKYCFPNDDSYKKKNYSLVSSDKEEQLFVYINENIEQYIQIYLRNCEGEIFDDETAALELINQEEIEHDSKIQYIDYLQTKIGNLAEINDRELWDKILNRELIIYNEKNIWEYYLNNKDVEDKLDILIPFIDSSTLPLEFGSIGDEETRNELFETLVKCNELSNERYAQLLPTFHIYYEAFVFEDIKEEKIKILIDKNIVSMSKENLEFIRENHENLIRDFLIINIEKYINLIEDVDFSIKEVLGILDEEVVDDKYKIKLLEHTTEKISLAGKHYSNKIKTYILQNNFNNSDLPYLIDNYSTERANIKVLIEKVLVEEVENIVSERIKIPYSLLKEISTSSTLVDQYKIDLFANSLSLLNLSQTIDIMRIIGLTEYEGLFNRKRPLILASDINKQILTIFKEKGWITKFEREGEDTKYYRAYGRSINTD